MCDQIMDFMRTMYIAIRFAELLTLLYCVGITDVDAVVGEKRPLAIRHVFKLLTLVGDAADANGIVSADDDKHKPSVSIDADRRCSCTYGEDARQLSCVQLVSSVALVRALNTPHSWCNRSSAAVVLLSSINGRNTSTSEYRNVRRVLIAHSLLANFTFDALKRFDSLNMLALNWNDFGESGGPLVIEGFQLTTLIELDLSDNYNLTHLRQRLLTTFPRLQTLRLDRNNLTKLESKSFANDIVPDLRNISMTGNSWRCQDIAWFINWLRFNASADVVLEDVALTECQSCDGRRDPTCFQSVTWDNFIERCPRNCTCFMKRALVAVDCSNLGYKDFPAVVPSDVGILYMQNNTIRSLHTLKSASSGYRSIRFLYLDNNSIDSINGLDGTNFEELIMLHMNGNRLTQLSVHVFEKLFTRNLDEVKLGNNPWSCECNTVVPFNDLLNSRRRRFKDIEQIRCSSNSTLQPNQPIHRLSASDFCTQTSSIHPLDIINVLLATLILVIVSKLLYDYRVFKRTGQIPICPFVNVCSRKPR